MKELKLEIANRFESTDIPRLCDNSGYVQCPLCCDIRQAVIFFIDPPWYFIGPEK